MHVGFTGTQKGLTHRQSQELALRLQELPLGSTFHHGDCVGADAEAHDIARRLSYNKVVIHPPINFHKRAWCSGTVVRPPKPYLERNHDIVDASDILIVCPAQQQEVQRSGTWATIRYAKKKCIPVIMIGP